MRYQFLNITSGRSKIVLFIVLILFGYLFSSFAALAIAKLAGYNQIMERLSNPTITDTDTLNLFRIVQIAMHMGLFLLGPVLYLLLVEQHPLQKFGLNRNPFQKKYLLIVVLMVVCLPGINYIHSLNQALHLPPWLSGAEKWMQQKEDSAKDLTDAFLSMKSYKDLAVNLIMFGLLPAIGEELFFRGALFTIIKEWTKRKHLTIFITAFLFSAIHLQFYGFLPRFLLGVGFGYLFVFTGTLWAPMIAHFINNSLAVVAAFFFFQGKSSVNQDDFGSLNSLTLNLLSIGVTLYIFRLIYQIKWSNGEKDEVRREWDSNP
jgi:membrane protease YdiL (CAAX protease family)